uniref:Uncharacterized protein n=1 Tax=Anguilla anguilla TaxID=7936 RepID=A0A0E9SDH2_ANGAN
MSLHCCPRTFRSSQAVHYWGKKGNSFN